jgi:transcriptional regulator with XRE-family HTH domain
VSFGTRLKQLRDQRGWTRYDLATRLRASYSAVAKYESDSRFPDQDTLALIANIFGTSTDYLLGRTDDPSPTPSYDESEVIIRNYPEPPEGFEELSPEQREDLDRATRNFQRQIIEMLLKERGQSRR